MEREIIKIRDYTITPGLRFISQGEYSAEWFMNECLNKKLDTSDGYITIDLDGTIGYSPSFLEETFGGIARKRGPDFARRIKIITKEEPWLEGEINKYINDVEKHKQ